MTDSHNRSERPKLLSAGAVFRNYVVAKPIAVAGRYLLPAAIFGYLRTQTPGKGGEIQLTDAIKRMLAERPAYAYVYPGKRQDIGNPDGYYSALTAFRTFGSSQVG